MVSTFIHFCGNFPAILKIGDNVLGTLENQTDTLCVEIENEKSFLLGVFPISNKNFLPSTSFFAEIKFKGLKPTTDSPQLEITKFEDNIFEIFLKPLCLNSFLPKKILKEFLVTKNLRVVFCANSFCSLEICFNNQIFYANPPENLTDTKCEFFEQEGTKFLLFFGKTPQNRDFLMIFENFFCKFEIEADVIEKKKNQIFVLTFAGDICNHGIVKKFELKKEAILKDEYVVFCNNQKMLPTNQKLVPLAFLEALNLEDFGLAKTFLSDDLAGSLDNETLKNFFGDFEEFFWNRHSTKENCFAFVFDGEPKTIKNFCFEVKDFKIVNIFEV